MGEVGERVCGRVEDYAGAEGVGFYVCLGLGEGEGGAWSGELVRDFIIRVFVKQEGDF
jgi:hypothetical protein